MKGNLAYAEEFAKYRILEERTDDDTDGIESDEVFRDKWIMTAKVAAKRFDFAPFPSGYCLFERFCPSDKTDEVTEQAAEWKAQADKLPPRFGEQVGRIWSLWQKNRAPRRQLRSGARGGHWHHRRQRQRQKHAAAGSCGHFEAAGRRILLGGQ